MVNFGCTFNPILLVNWMAQNNVLYAIDKVFLNRQHIVFTSMLEFGKRLPYLKRKRVFIFDCKEKLEYVQGIKIYNEDQVEKIYNFLLNNDDFGPQVLPEIKVIKPIHVLIEKNKSIGILHEYNTALYDITKKSVREKIKKFVVDFVSGHIKDKDIDNLVKQTEEDMRQSKIKDSLNYILSLLKDEGFKKLQSAMKDLHKMKGKVERSHIEAIALQHNVEPYDLNYFFAVIQKQKGAS